MLLIVGFVQPPGQRAGEGNAFDRTLRAFVNGHSWYVGEIAARREHLTFIIDSRRDPS